MYAASRDHPPSRARPALVPRRASPSSQWYFWVVGKGGGGVGRLVGRLTPSPPVPAGCVWRYVRASASYCPYLPPLCDPRDGHLLVDGCFVNNVPGQRAHRAGRASECV